ncbi:MAG: cytochrome C oxidase subunit IV family protein [Bacteroidetes bacterium]|nr:cytochrome C oxidase subunit IV family protein [Bacteroidota bacterium]MBS1630324.1 cytochrome C oxidase subunit IV family protein [Bacteroidota bacterium]
MAEHHGADINSEGSKKQVKRIIKVTIFLTIITALEVVLGLWGHHVGVPRAVTSALFLIMTLLKAAYIVKVFMHLGDETRNMIVTILIPLTLFIWFIIAFLADGGFWLHMNHSSGIHYMLP